jgi:hypothetical protein
VSDSQPCQHSGIVACGSTTTVFSKMLDKEEPRHQNEGLISTIERMCRVCQFLQQHSASFSALSEKYKESDAPKRSLNSRMCTLNAELVFVASLGTSLNYLYEFDQQKTVESFVYRHQVGI